MCGIFGYMGSSNAPDIIHQGLKRLEYRGYDSWGISTIENGKIKTTKDVGHLPEKSPIESKSVSTGVGHTRWATHGGVTITNAHPHYSTDNSFVIAQNGIVENYTELKKSLENLGYVFKTQVDTEVIVKLVEHERKSSKTLRDALVKAFKQLDGRNTVIVLDSKQDQILAIRNGSPLILGTKEKDVYLASDPLAFNQYSQNIVEINNGELIEIKDNKYKIYDIYSEKYINRKPREEKQLDIEINKGDYDHYMIKEIVEQKGTILKSTNYSQKELKPLVDRLKKSKSIYTIGAGNSLLFKKDC